MFIVYTFSEEEKEDIKSAMKNEKNLVVKERLQAVHMTMQNLKRYEVAKILNRHPEFVGKWLKTYKKFGIDGLCEKRGGVRHHHLTQEQEEFVKDIVTNSLPSDCNYSQPTWSGALLVDLIKNMYSKTYTRNGVYALLERLGVSYKKANKIDPKKSHKVIQEWKLLMEKNSKI
jgi:transposase